MLKSVSHKLCMGQIKIFLNISFQSVFCEIRSNFAHFFWRNAKVQLYKLPYAIFKVTLHSFKPVQLQDSTRIWY